MNTKTIRKQVVVTALCLAVVPAGPAFAYIDPGTSSLVLQMLIGGIIGGMFTIKLYWQRLKAFVSGKTETKLDESDGHQNQEDG
jgi:uncharacterized membrane protein YqgA involved in biofilm formation